MGGSERAAVSSSSVKCKGVSKRHIEATREEEGPVPVVAQVRGGTYALSKLSLMKEKGNN